MPQPVNLPHAGFELASAASGSNNLNGFLVMGLKNRPKKPLNLRVAEHYIAHGC